MEKTEPDSVPGPILTIDELITHADVVRSKELAHKLMISTLSSVFNETVTKDNMIAWALSGFPGAYAVKRLDLEPPVVCSDGVKREIAEYLNFISSPSKISDHFNALEAALPGIQVTYSLPSPNTMILHVTKK